MTSFEEELDQYLAAKDTTAAPSASQEPLALISTLGVETGPQTANVQHKQNQLPQGFEFSADPQYACNQSTGMWLDLYSGDLSYYDQDTQTYIPVQQQTSVPKSLEFQGMLRLVVVESKCWPVGNVVDINIDEGGLAIGRDRLQDHTVHHLRLPEIEVSRYHAHIYVSSDDKGNRDVVTLENKSPAASAGSEDGEIDADGTEGLSEGECMPNSNMDDHGPTLQTCAQPSMYIIDQGSTHGTFVNGVRLSDPKVTSKPQQLKHLDQVELGSTKLEFHIHEQWACTKCHNSGHNEILTLTRKDDGVDQGLSKPCETHSSSQTAATQHDNINQERINNLNAIKRRYLHTPKSGISKVTVQYTDRAKIRRQLQVKPHHSGGASTISPYQHNTSTAETNSHVKQQSDTAVTPIEQDNKGFSLLQKIGWVPGSGLGANESGIVDPVEVTGNISRAGLGVPADQPQESRQGRVARITRQRFHDM
ncbi:hypothetical protein IW140_006418 [Coemansia sp. RSA 1813]|nr:hypothetical protein EV178_002224 [Coemansia sp. RSA 1646]KAJ1765603.1 hypothetical protein LPJ74_006283 [Coemansia sp. RSA 1843]KAJ2085345.1 hypothetical protein IW138_006380 [Coemansia sp. RSA 986]KAJ2217055.1 hypothetical protein EV179_000822 [Coemansia sp. RSA 487]KAJ2562458.1 hypothetical protein IW140_006418 [Coemansia sp. RSA 1813]